MKHFWMNSVLPIAAIFSFRMLGLFMLIPVFTVYATELTAATPVLIGLALGSYGLSQGLLQIPMGMLSDRFGRKPILTIGLLLFMAGSLLGALTDSIYGMILARIIQGTGAIGSVLIALLADLTPDEHRTKAMAIIGAAIGLSFSVAIVLSPGITQSFGLPGIFYFTTFLALAGLILLHVVIPTPQREPFHYDSETSAALIINVLKNRHLQRLNIGIFCQHFILTSTFFAIPLLLQQHIEDQHLSEPWQFYLPLMFFSFLLMIPFMIFAERQQKIKPVFLAAVIITASCQGLLAFIHQHWTGLTILLFLYFVAFNFLEANLPSLVSRQADSKSKGTGMGVYSSAQFLGLFAGGVSAGLIFQQMHAQGIFLFNCLLALGWALIALFMKPNVYEITLIVPYKHSNKISAKILELIQSLDGVRKVVISEEEQAIYAQINKRNYVPGSIESILSKQ